MRNTAASRSMVGSEATLAHASEAFQLRCQAQNLSPLTCDWYKRRLGRFQAFLEAHGVTVARGVTPHLIRLYLDSMRAEGLSSGLIARDFGALKCYFRFLARERLIPQNPVQLVEKPRMEQKLIRPLSMDQVRVLLSKANQKRFTGHRVWTMAVLILDTGLRRAELLGLKRDDVDFGKGVLRVMGKGAKEREVPFGTTAKQALWNYLMRRGELAGQDFVFVSQFGDSVCPRWLNKSFKRLGELAGIKGVRVSPHTLRHTFATQYIKNGGDAFSLQQILGHSTLEMVKIYVGLADNDVAHLHRKFSPMDRMGLVPGAKRRVIVR
jgi:integrase/recombinase XerD